MPSLSTTVTKVLEICNRPNTSPNDLNRVISLDPVLTGQVLKLINSAYYGLPTNITSLTRAIIMLGLNTVKNLALSTAILGSIGGKESFQALSMDDFWTHSICVGVTAKSLALANGVPAMESEEYFVAGMLHDLGKIPLNGRFPKDYVEALDLVDSGHCPLDRAENTIFDIDHSLVGGLISEKWQLNENMSNALCHHHAPEEATEGNRRLIFTVALANLFANMMKIGSSGDLFPEEAMLDGLLEEVGADWPSLSQMVDQVMEDIEKAKIFLKVST